MHIKNKSIKVVFWYKKRFYTKFVNYSKIKNQLAK